MKSLRKRLTQTELQLRHSGIGFAVFAIAFLVSRLIGWRVGAELAWIGGIFFAVVALMEAARWGLLKRRALRKQAKAAGRPERGA